MSHRLVPRTHDQGRTQESPETRGANDSENPKCERGSMRNHADNARRAPHVAHRLVILASAILLVLILVQGCSSGGARLGSGTTVNLNQLWGMAAQEAGASADHATLVQLEMTLSPVGGMSLPPEQTARAEELEFVVWAHGPTIEVAATWPERGAGELSMETHEPRNDPMPPPVGYPLDQLFSRLDYLGTSALFDGLRPYTERQTARLLLVYPPPEGPYGEEWDVPLLVLRGDSLELVPFGEDKVWRTDMRKWMGIPGVFQVLSGSNEKLLAILVVAQE